MIQGKSLRKCFHEKINLTGEIVVAPCGKNVLIFQCEQCKLKFKASDLKYDLKYKELIENF